MATRRGVARRPFQPLVDLARVFAPPLLQPATENVRGNLQTDREQRRFVLGASLREMRPRAVNQHVEPRMQPEVNLNTDAIVVTVGMQLSASRFCPARVKNSCSLRAIWFSLPALASRVI